MYNSTERNKVRMMGILPSDGMDNIPVDIQTVTADVPVVPGAGMDSLRMYPRIPDGATQVVNNVSQGVGLSDFYTVTAGKTLYLVSISWSWVNASVGVGTGYIMIRTDAPATWFRVAHLISPADVGLHDHLTFAPALECGPGYIFRVQSLSADCTIYATIFGYEM